MKQSYKKLLVSFAIIISLIAASFALATYHSELRSYSDIIPNYLPGVSSNVSYIQYDVSGTSSEVNTSNPVQITGTAKLQFTFLSEDAIYSELSINYANFIPYLTFWINPTTMAPIDSEYIGNELINASGKDRECMVYQSDNNSNHSIFYVDSQSKLILAIECDLFSATYFDSNSQQLSHLNLNLDYKEHSLKMGTISSEKFKETTSFLITGIKETTTHQNDSPVTSTKEVSGTLLIELLSRSMIDSDNQRYIIGLTISINNEQPITFYSSVSGSDLQPDYWNYKYTKTFENLSTITPNCGVFAYRDTLSFDGTITITNYDPSGKVCDFSILKFESNGGI